jgi:3-hydroxyacyl-CoA dehydrogenase
MDMVRAILMGLGCFGLLVIGSCTMLGYGTVAVLDKAAEVVREDQKDPAKQALRAAAAEHAMAEYSSNYEDERNARAYSESTDEDYSDFGEPTVDIEKD